MMINSERIQALVHKLEMDSARWLNYLAIFLVVLALAVWYDTHCYRNFDSAEAMDAAQLGRHIAEGRGFTTDYIRPFDVYLLQKHNGGMAAQLAAGTNALNLAQLNGRHPDLANPPLYPLLLAGLFKITSPDWKVDRHKPFWSDSGRFQRYKPEFMIAVFNQMLLVAVLWLAFMIARTILDAPAAWLVTLLLLGSDALWRYSVTGLPMLLMLVIFLALVWCLVLFEAQSRAAQPDPRRVFLLVAGAGLLAGLGMLTRYSFGWVMAPVAVFILLYGGSRRAALVVVAFLVFAVVVSPWIIRNLAVSGACFGTAGYAVVLDTSGFPGMRLWQTLEPDLYRAGYVREYLTKFFLNFRYFLETELPRLAGGWMAMLFLAGLLLELRNPIARRMRYFLLMCLGVLLLVSTLIRSNAPVLGYTTENLLDLLIPLVTVFGVAFFLTLLAQMELPSPYLRYAVVGVVALLSSLSLILTLMPPKASPLALPYYPPDVQRFSAWIEPDELMMSDIPWAVAWYGDRQCTLTTVNSKRDFFQFNDYVKHVSALYLTAHTLDCKLLSECIQGGVNSWPSFVFERMAVQKIDTGSDIFGRAYFRAKADDDFPLQTAPSDISTGLFLADHQRWKTQ